MKIKMVATLLIVATASMVFAAGNPTIKSFLAGLEKKAKTENSKFQGFDIKRGEKIFHTKRTVKGKEMSCVTCHGTDLSKKGKDKRTGKVIEPLSPSTNAKRLTKEKDIKKWLRRNFKDVYEREGTAIEKGDVLKYILSK